MGRYYVDKVSEQLQAEKGVQVRNVTESSWSFERDGARLNLRVLPGCCGVLLVYQLSGPERPLFRLLTYVQRAAQRAEFGLVLLTLRSDSRLRPMLAEATWAARSFTNPRTRNSLEVLTYVVPPKRGRQRPLPQQHED